VVNSLRRRNIGLDDMKDYKQIYEACLILERYVDKDSDRNLQASHDMISLCFDVVREQVSEEDKDSLAELGVFFDDNIDVWVRFTSC